MSILLGILGFAAALVILLLIIALFVKKEYALEREIIINRPVGEVYNYIKLLKNQDNYSVWNRIDPGMQKTYTGIDGTIGFLYAWDSKNKKAGKGEQEIVNVQQDERLGMKIHFIKPFEGMANAYLTTTAVAAGQTKVKWGLDSSMKYPMNIMLLFMNMESMLGKDLAAGLADLKTILEKQD
ncbi:MAG: SRPBCC family protein [Chitinophagaceae bacterium]